MRDTKDIQHDLDAAQDDLERDIAELKQVIEDKIEGPKHAFEVAEEMIEAPITFVRQHSVLIGVGVVFALGLLVGRLIPQS
ncbi:MAG: hypothetical protein ABJE66_32390 [Deltaproteobacteria bacterium]